MNFIKSYENYNQNNILIIVDVQKSFKKYFTDLYINELKKYCNQFTEVYQIWDNHFLKKNIDKDYLYDKTPDTPIHNDLYEFPNQKELIEKRYNYDVDVDFYKKILDDKTYKDAKDKQSKNLLKRGNYFKTTEGTYIIYIGNNHIWYHLPKKLHDLFNRLRGKEVTFVGGSDQECLLDVETAAKVFGVKIKRNFKFIYSATNCPIK